MARVLALSESDVIGILDLETCIPPVERAFASFSRGASAVFPVVRERLGVDDAGIFGIKSAFAPEEGWLGLKAGGYWERNRDKSIPPHQSSILIIDPETGQTKALVAANAITWLRTGAVGAIAAKYLAPRHATTAAVIGCGMQGQIQARALLWALPGVKQLRVYDRSRASVRTFENALRDTGIELIVSDTVEGAVAEAEVIVTTTPSWEPIVHDEWVRPNVHITAIGADTKGKNELDVELFRRAKVVVDDWTQASQIGESQHAYGAGVLTESTVWAELGAICAGTTPGREDDDGLTIFDSTGIALQDLAVANLAMEVAVARGVGTWLEL
jgi:alanine dehydrogenase